ncbi:MAG: class I SAM-dependent methyltransferase [Actinobacteria bacterium]|nr:class I SAM-dependent methyltransferase [Actinomycetota bacterium]
MADRADLAWLTRWDRQQELYIPHREARFGAMLDVLEALVGMGRLREDFTLVDLACGPAALATRCLERFDRASAVGIEVDPVTLHLGAEHLSRFGGRLRLVEASITTAGWLDQLAVERVDVFALTTALHWLSPAELTALFGDLAGALPPGGVFLNGDNLGFSQALPTFTAITSYLQNQHRTCAAHNGADDWQSWRAAARQDPVLGPLCERRDALFAASDSQDEPPPLDLYEHALGAAGFAEVDSIWQSLDDRVLLAIR